jgi:DNA integrity scanning protein DisA with diadenylate cyclase activity
MDAKENQLIDYYHNRIVNNVFNEKDVYMLLILLRRHANKKSPVFEFANFVAHREKDRGYIHEYVRDKKHILDRLGKINATLVIQPVFTLEDIKKSFNDVLKSLDKQELSEEVIRDMTLCTIVLLQDVRLVDKKNRSIGNLSIGINKETISLLGQIAVKNDKNETVFCVFPALEVPNIYTNMFNQEDPAILKVVAEVIRILGNLEIKFKDENKIDKNWG